MARHEPALAQRTGLGDRHNSIIDQLMAVEGQSKTRLQLADTRAQARQTGLRGLATKLGALRDAANALKSTTTWGDVRQLVSSDPARVGLRAQGSVAPGVRVIEVTALAVTDQHAFNYTSSASSQTISIGSFSLAVDPDSTISTVAAAINDRDERTVHAPSIRPPRALASRCLRSSSHSSEIWDDQRRRSAPQPTSS